MDCTSTTTMYGEGVALSRKETLVGKDIRNSRGGDVYI
jgi:hypothetical protein